MEKTEIERERENVHVCVYVCVVLLGTRKERVAIDSIQVDILSIKTE